MSRRPQHNVTLDPSEFSEKPFPCPLCNTELRLKITRKQKPYCMCLECGIQIFFRGQLGIARLQEMVATEKKIAIEFPAPVRPFALYRRLQHLKRQKELLEEKQGIIFRDPDRDVVIAAVETEIERLRAELQQIGPLEKD